jgi:8-oxo-dGTP diphosphatase
MAEDKLFYVTQKAFINKNGQILILNDPTLGLDLPGGKIQEGETDLIASLKREVEEETNLEIEVISPFITWYFKVPDNIEHRNVGKIVFVVGYKCKYLSGELKLSEEHDSFTWVNKDNYKKFKRDWEAYTALEKYFNQL